MPRANERYNDGFRAGHADGWQGTPGRHRDETRDSAWQRGYTQGEIMGRRDRKRDDSEGHGVPTRTGSARCTDQGEGQLGLQPDARASVRREAPPRPSTRVPLAVGSLDETASRMCELCGLGVSVEPVYYLRVRWRKLSKVVLAHERCVGRRWTIVRRERASG